MSFALRHKPDEAGITLDGHGWCVVDALMAALARQGLSLLISDLDHIVASNAKQRFEFSADRLRIRARQGHSVAITLNLAPSEPPTVLYHGTASRFLESILRGGLVRGARHHVHLSADTTTAAAVGQRHGNVVTLQVDAQRMHADGLHFFVTENHVWLTDHVPPIYLSVISA